MRVGVVGLGSMGMGAALNLARKGAAVVGCDPREQARAELEAAGGSAVGSAAGLPDDLDALVLFVVNAQQVDDVLFGAGGAAARLPGSAVLVNCTTVSPDTARGLAGRVAVPLLDAPVSGGAVAAREGRMGVMASGTAKAFARARPVLESFAGKIWELGDEPGVGSTVKMVNQLLAGVHIAAAAEALALGIRAGADPATLFEVISASAGSSWMWQNRVPHILAGDDTPLSSVNIFVKDLGIVLDQARQMTFPLPLAATAHQLFLAAAAGGHGGRDDAFVIRVWEALAGIQLPVKP